MAGTTLRARVKGNQFVAALAMGGLEEPHGRRPQAVCRPRHVEQRQVTEERNGLRVLPAKDHSGVAVAEWRERVMEPGGGPCRDTSRRHLSPCGWLLREIKQECVVVSKTCLPDPTVDHQVTSSEAAGIMVRTLARISSRRPQPLPLGMPQRLSPGEVDFDQI
mmetsp:Transcript_1509/g.4774  ORF Transcript_1509/g.4774 Transcript_1509/m.4774 type:complete len:163 (+) Transcript_1509:762-1250(+)